MKEWPFQKGRACLHGAPNRWLYKHRKTRVVQRYVSKQTVAYMLTSDMSCNVLLLGIYVAPVVTFRRHCQLAAA